ncbi:GGDEF domain-containing protein [Ruminococcus flavefaciens]|uniref:Diguanylate cyclase (GGDEF) domain-containing protein n=1 Tax=Ruminococcus flavefaciens TaxID=1265 RepID=A0A1M7MJR0_RUMFL|nr:GGDEF domain-containing protein [Ruminococcus flavefaciens]SHM91114.1 diguanylate cyclase (GGDEF) domain-containing protein [Ruminococcus flavefaciens]
MAKEKSRFKGSGAYVFAGILLAIVYLLNTFLVEGIYWGNQNVSQTTSKTMNSLNSINGQLSEINNDAISIAAGIKTNMDAIVKDTNNRYANIVDAEHTFESISDISDTAKRRYTYAKNIINTYKKRLDDMGTGAVTSGNYEEMGYILKQDIYPMQVVASEMLTSTIDVVSRDTGTIMRKNTIRSYALMTLMMVVAILGEIAIWLFAKKAKKARLELEERERSLAEVDAKLKTTRQKASDLAVINVLTGMKNRYALDNDISDRLESGRFQVAVFDMDNFRSINDTYGYDFGDEYLAAVAEKLKEEFSEVAEIYNITGNEFCFVFNKNISESQAMGIAQNIQRVMSSPYEVLNLAVQLPCSGAVYHYLPGDCLNVNSLLVKLDTAMRNAKMNGGNMISTVMNI